MANQQCDTQSREKTMKIEDERIKATLDKVKNIICVMSGKGGVGKSTVAVNLAVSLARDGQKVGLMDVDLHGPTVPVMLGTVHQKLKKEGNYLAPLDYSKNLKVMSIGNLLDTEDRAVIWRGPLKIGAIRQFISDVNWGALDYLIVDSPPGTGDEPLTIAQTMPRAKALIVTTPQEVSLADVRKSISFCQNLKMDVIGLIENMAGFKCPNCGHQTDLFGAGGGETTARTASLPFLGSVPIDPAVVFSGDAGKPPATDAIPGPGMVAFSQIVLAVKKQLDTDNAKATENASTEVSENTSKGETCVIAVPTSNGVLCEHFGHCETMQLFNVVNGKIQGVKSETPPLHAPGVMPKWLSELGATRIIAGGMGQKAIDLFEQFGVHVITGASSAPSQEVVESHLAGALATTENVCDH